MGNMFRGNTLSEVIKDLGARGVDNVSVAMSGTITSFDTSKYLAKVMIGILGIETGWIPVGTLIAGNGYGIMAIPEIGTEVTVLFDSGDLQSGKVVLANFNAIDVPPQQLFPGEIFMRSQGGARVKLDKQGRIIINDGGKAAARVGDTVDLNPSSLTYGQIISGNDQILM